MTSHHRPPGLLGTAGVACLLCLIAGCVHAGMAERIALRSADGASLEEIRVSLDATRVRTIGSGGQIWEVPAGTREEALLRFADDARLAYIEALDGSEYQVFSDDPVAGGLDPVQEQIVGDLRSLATTGELRVAPLQAGRFTLELLRFSPGDPEVFELNLLPAQRFGARTEKVHPRDSGFTWQADLVDGGEATLVVNGENVTGLVQAGSRRYAIKPLGGGVSAIHEVEVEEFPPHP